MIWAIVGSRYCFCWLYRASPSLAAKNIIHLISVLTIWWRPCVKSSLVLLEEGVCYDQCISLVRILLVFALLHSSFQGQICLLLQVFLELLLLHSSPLLFSHKKKWNCAIYRDVVELRDCHTMKSEREGPSVQGDWERGSSVENQVFKEWVVNHIECFWVVEHYEYMEGSLNLAIWSLLVTRMGWWEQKAGEEWNKQDISVLKTWSKIFREIWSQGIDFLMNDIRAYQVKVDVIH